METVHFQGSPCHTCGSVPRPGDSAPCFTLTSKDLAEVTCKDFVGKRIVLNVFPSLDTPVCAASVRRFNDEASKTTDTVVVCVSMDLPFAGQRFCVANGIENCVVTSAFRSPEFIKNYGLEIVDGPLKGLLTRAVLIIDTDGRVIFTDLVDEITHEPDYEAAMSMLS